MSDDVVKELREIKRLLAGDSLGFCEPPRVRVIYANRKHNDCLWYFWNGGNDTHEPIADSAIKGVVKRVAIADREYKGKATPKLNISFMADKPYIIQTALSTAFARGILTALSHMDDAELRKPIVIAVEAGKEDSVLLAKIYANKIPVIADWDSDVSAEDLVDFVSKKLGAKNE